LIRRLSVLPVLLALAGCGAPNTLEGSLGDQVSLTFDTVEIQRSPTAIAVAYLKALPGGGGHDTVLELVATVDAATLEKAGSINLVEKVGDGLRGAATRAVSGDPRRDLPPLVRGTLAFEGAATSGKSVSGSFSVLFDQGGSVGAGRTAFGDFTATVAEAAP
jgi:hypothetical protein